MRIEADVKLDFKDVLIRPKRSTLESRRDVSLLRTFITKHTKRNFEDVVPIFAANMDTTGTFETAIELAKHKMLTAIHKYYSVEEWCQFAKKYHDVLQYVCVSVGITNDDFVKLRSIIRRVNVRMIMIDVANGYTEKFIKKVKQIRYEFPGQILIAGNVATAEMVEELIINGVDIVKVGIGGGSSCRTRAVAGVGYPQLSSIIECADAAHGVGGLIIADGGCTNSGDIAKAFGAGADFVMLGGMMAGHDESGGKLITDGGKPYKEFYGMSSDTAMNKHNGGVATYRASEGRTLRIPYKGPLKDTVQEILGGLRSACTYVGASKLKELSKRTTFVRVTQQVNRVFL